LTRQLVVGALVACVLAAAGCGGAASKPLPRASAALSLASPAFAGGAALPRRYTCDGAGDSPPLDWTGVPGGTREIDLVVEDPDAKNFLHWAVLGMPATARSIPRDHAPAGAVQTRNGFGRPGWGAPCPPRGSAHRYVFALYADDKPLGLDGDASQDEIDHTIAAHALARGTLTARYARH
jgi:Raf kinase inhibitor-like YbhB/YbcL family protein